MFYILKVADKFKVALNILGELQNGSTMNHVVVSIFIIQRENSRRPGRGMVLVTIQKSKARHL